MVLIDDSEDTPDDDEENNDVITNEEIKVWNDFEQEHEMKTIRVLRNPI